MTTFKKIILTIMVLSCLAITDTLAEIQKSNESGKVIPDSGALSGHRYRVVVSTDIGGTDPDDFQSMVHLLVYADVLDIEGLISSPYGPGRKEHILQVIDCYASDYENLRNYSDCYPTPDTLRTLAKQGDTEQAPYAGVRQSTEGSQWIVDCARRDDTRPLYVLVWGGIEDLAQALYDAPDILNKLRVYWIGGPNKKWSPDAYQYIVENHPELWIIESNATYRGWFVGGNQSGQWDNKEFVTQHIAGKGALGDFFVSKKDDVKMGDTPSVGWLLKGTPDDPTQPGWGGSFVRAWERPYSRFERMTKKEDRMEIFGILELTLPMGDDVPQQPEAVLVVENQKLSGHAPGDGTIRFRFSPKSKKAFNFKIESNVTALDGQTGGITAYIPSPDMAQHPAMNLPNWWTDDPSPEVAEGPHIGAKTVNRWREDFLGDFAKRMLRCQSPASAKTIVFAQKNSSNLEASEQQSSVNTASDSKVSTRLRVIMSTDFPPIGVVKEGDVPNTQKSDPDDMQSMVRFLLYANEFDVEGLIASAGTFAMEAHKDNILGVIDQYEKVYENLRKHDPTYPNPNYLRSVTFEGKGNNHGINIKWGRNKQPYTDIIGKGMDSEASNAIIAAVDKPDPRPIWIGVWGGPREVAQAIWDVQNTRSEEELKAFISRLRIFLIAYQDATHGWLMNEFPDLFIIESRKTYQGMFGGHDPISNLAWVNENIRNNHGPLCDVYPHEGMGCTGICEGDSPTFLYLVSANRGINNPEDPTQSSWGGQYVRDGSTNHYVDGPSGSSISRWRKDYQKEFQERADWCIEAAPAATQTAAPATTPIPVFAVNCGGDAYTSSDGTVYVADTGYSGGSTYSNVESISGTTDDTLYQSERYGDSTYSIAVPNGHYLVTLHFAETYHAAAGSRSFGVRIEGTEHISDLDIYAKAGGNAAYITQTNVSVSDGELNIEFVTDVENAKINAIKVSPAESDAAFSTSPDMPLAGRTGSPPKWLSVQNIGLTKLKPRVVVLTDISTWETDDHESLIRFLVHADMFEIEALILSTGYSIDTLNDSTKSGFINLIHGAVDAYEKDLPNLMKRSNQVGHEFDDARQEIGYWPSAQYLRDRTMTGSRNRGKQYLGNDNDSPGSDIIIKLADETDDPRPIWVTVWGGGNTVAQSIYRVKKDRTAEQFKAFLRKIRVYTITDQDRTYTGKEPHSYSSHGWMRSVTGNNLLFIWDECAWKAHNSTGKSNWDQYAIHIQGHGNLGIQYPKYKYGVEGDTPSFLYLMPTGLNNPEDPSQCSWGGTFSGDANNLWRESGSCKSYFDRFYPAAFNNFAARMDWAKDGTGNRNPVIVLDGDDSISILTKTPREGTTVTLDASQTSDPDGDNLTFKWWIQSDAGTYPGNVNISNNSSSIATVNVPSDSAGKCFHVICEVIDDESHNLSDYRRIIFEPAN